MLITVRTWSADAANRYMQGRAYDVVLYHEMLRFIYTRHHPLFLSNNKNIFFIHGLVRGTNQMLDVILIIMPAMPYSAVTSIAGPMNNLEEDLSN